MRAGLFKITLATLIGGFLTWQLTKNNSYIQIVFGNYTLDMSFWSLVLILSILFVVTLLLKNTIRVIVDPGQKLIKDFSELKAKKNQSLISRGLLYFIQDEWINARKDLEKSAKNSPMPVVNYLAAAFSAYEAGDFEDADQLIAKAQKNNSKNLGSYAKTERISEIIKKNSVQGDIPISKSEAIGIDLEAIIKSPKSTASAAA